MRTVLDAGSGSMCVSSSPQRCFQRRVAWPFNLVSDDVGYRGVAFVLMAGAVIAATTWLRRLPPRAPLARYTPPVLLTLALAPTALALVAPRAWAGPATLAAAALVAVAVLIPTTLETAIRLLLGAAATGLGAAELRGGDALSGAVTRAPHGGIGIWRGPRLAGSRDTITTRHVALLAIIGATRCHRTPDRW